MSTVTGTATQNYKYEARVAGNCDVIGCDRMAREGVTDCNRAGCLAGITPYGVCNQDEWIEGEVGCGCGIRQPICSKLDPKVCPSLVGPQGNAFIGATWRERPSLNAANAGTATVNCNYDVTKITTLGQVDTWRQRFGQNEDYDRIILPRFCSGATSSCPPDPLTGEARSACSRLLATGVEGDLCRNWAARVQGNAATSGLVDAAKRVYCSTATTSDCNCLNRGRDPIYARAGGAKPYNDACWWLPCKDPNNYLVTTDLRAEGCPANICQQINEFIPSVGSVVEARELQQSINCNFAIASPNQPGAIAPPTGPTPQPPLPFTPAPQPGSSTPTQPTGPAPAAQSFFQRYRVWIIIGIVIVVLLILALILIPLLAKPQASPPVVVV